jgi:UDP-N-acetylglucosamine 2-epimerase
MARDQIQVLIGTKAQYIKTAPLLRLMDAQDVGYRLIDSGQHAGLAAGLRAELGVREPDTFLGGTADVASIPAAIAWSVRSLGKAWSPKRVRRDVFGGTGGICVVHGDTPSTFVGSVLARRAGLRVAHLEAGLRSGDLLHPFPEEMIRVVVMRMSSLLFAPGPEAVANLKRMKVRGRVIRLTGNTSAEALKASAAGVGDGGQVVATMHRVENLHRGGRLRAFCELVTRVAASRPVTLVAHPPTSAALTASGLDGGLRAAGVDLIPLQSHHRFVEMLAGAPFVITDGGSVQEECALLGVPTLLWRERTERPDGIGDNVVLSRYSPRVIDDFLADPERYRLPARQPDINPSAEILEVLQRELASNLHR